MRTHSPSVALGAIFVLGLSVGAVDSVAATGTSNGEPGYINRPFPAATPYSGVYRPGFGPAPVSMMPPPVAPYPWMAWDVQRPRAMPTSAMVAANSTPTSPSETDTAGGGDGTMAASAGDAEAATADASVAEAKGIIKQFATRLQGELKAAIKSGGPAHAVEVCNAKAPAIAAELSAETGWDVGRTSLKVRNSDENMPDPWEQSVLAQFEERKQGGESVETIAFAETVDEGGAKSFRFMKAIPTGEVCLACHGSDITPEVAAEIDRSYPNDQARGFAVGDIRGAFTLSKPL
jgi:hypothetical protein